MRGKLASRSSQAAEIDALAVCINPERLGKEPNAEHRENHGGAGDLVGMSGIEAVDPGVKKGLEIEQDRMLAGCNQVLVVEIGGLKRVQQCEVAPLAPV